MGDGSLGLPDGFKAVSAFGRDDDEALACFQHAEVEFAVGFFSLRVLPQGLRLVGRDLDTG